MQADEQPAATSARSSDAPPPSPLPALVPVRGHASSPSSSSASASPAPTAPRGASVQAQATLKSISAPPLSPATSPNPLPVASTSSSPAPPPSSAPSTPAPTSSPPVPPQKKVVLLRRPSSPVDGASAAQVGSSPAVATNSGDPVAADVVQRAGDLSLGDADFATTDARTDGLPPLDPVLHAALNHPRDRLLLLRAEVEMERFVSSTSLSRLPLAPPHFQPGLNSYQRLLIHRLADMFGIIREVEAAPAALWNPTMINPSTGQPQGVVVLVKSDASQPPAAKLATYVPAPDPPAAAPIATSPHLPSRPPTPTTAESPTPAIVPTSAPAVPSPVFKILPRSVASRGASSSASSIIGEDDGGSSASAGTSAKGKGRRELTLVEREAAYKEARERIFAQSSAERVAPPAPPSVASSAAGGEDAASVQSAGYGITRPSSAGSTFSRSSAALSVSGQRPPPSIASESSSGIRSGYVGGGYYPPPPLQQPHYGMRPAAPSFDPGTGSWTYGQAGVAPSVPEYSYPYGGGSAQPMFQHPGSTYSGYQPPLPPPPPPPHGAYDPAPPAAAWARGLPSPALSTSSGGSLQQFPPFPPHVSQPAPPSSDASGGSGAGAGYLMRFPEGAVVTPGGSVVGPPAPYATVAGSAATAFRAPSAPSASGSSASLSSQAARSTRRSPEASVAGRSDAGSSSAGRSDAASAASGAEARKRGRQTTMVASRGNADGKDAEPPTRQPHPSLPAKPAWVASQPPLERPAPSTPASIAPPAQAKSAPVLAPQAPALPPGQPQHQQQQLPFASPAFAPSPSGRANGAGYHPFAVPPPPPPGAGAWTRPSGAAPPYAPSGLAYATSTEYSALPLNGAPVPYYGADAYPAHAHHPPPAWQTHAHAAVGVPPAHVGAPHAQGFAAGAAGAGADGLLGMPEMRRPPPRNTQLFDPNKPGGGGGGAGPMRRGGSAAGQGRRG
ncbi:hypothetical protein JCM3770_000159 [Rhodotorula araucariae]